MHCRHSLLYATLLLALAALIPAAPAFAEGVYLRAAVGSFNSGSARFSDLNCAQAQPPALFGCQTGDDGRPIGAYGDFGSGALVELGVGHRFLPWFRGELLLSYVPNLDFSGNANFVGVSGAQPVSGSGNSLAAFAVGWVDLPAIGRWRPYFGFGAGFARNHIGPMTYGFPGLGAGAITRTGGGSYSNFGWFASIGVTCAVTENISLDLGLRYSDLGEVRTEAGAITIVRKGQTFVIDAGGTRAGLNMTSVVLGFLYRF